MVTHINLRLDTREWDIDLDGAATMTEVKKAIEPMLAAHPHVNMLLIVTRTGRVPINWARLGLWYAVSAMLAMACWLIAQL